MDLKIINKGSSDFESLDQSCSTFLQTEKQSLTSKDIELKTDIEKGKDFFYDEKVFGVDIKKPTPMKIGRVFAFCYFKNVPLITIGPDCIFLLNKICWHFVCFLL